MTNIEVADLIDLIIANTQYVDRAVRMDALHLASSILRGKQYAIQPRYKIAQVLKKLCPPEHPVWQYITKVAKE